MKRCVALLGVLLILMAACAGATGKKSATETVVISYESLGFVAFPTVLAYLQQRELNGSLAGDKLAEAKKNYAQARGYYIDAGDLLKMSINSPVPTNSARYMQLLKEVAILLANLSGGSVSGNELTIPKKEESK